LAKKLEILKIYEKKKEDEEDEEEEQRIPKVCLKRHFTTIYVFTQVFLIPNKHMSFTNRAISDF